MAVERVQIAVLHMERLSAGQIAKRLRVRKSAIHHVVEKFKKSATDGDTKKGYRSPKMSRKYDHAIKPAVISSPTSSSKKILKTPLLQCPTSSYKLRANLESKVTDISVRHEDVGDAVASPTLKNWPLFGQKFSKFGQSTQLHSHVSEVVSIFQIKAT